MYRFHSEPLEPRTLFATFPAGFTAPLVGASILNGTAMAVAPDGAIFVAQQAGQLRVIRQGALLPNPYISLTVDSNGERGLLGVAFDPNYANNNFIYLYYTATTPAIHNRISRFTTDADNPNVVVPGSEVPLMDLENLGATNHNGGAIHFGPDGKLYIAVGENANGSNAQTLSNRLGKILRVNSDGTIPSDNPFFNDNTVVGVNKSIWALGLRNPFTFAFDPANGTMYVDDVGQNTWEEVNVGVAGANYGWPTIEGMRTTETPPANYHDPLYVYDHSNGSTAITGGEFYRPPAGGGGAFPASYNGAYFFSDLGGGFVRSLDAGTANATDFGAGASAIVDMATAYDGSLYYLQRGGTQGVYRIRYTDTTKPTVNTPSFQFDSATPTSRAHRLQYIFSEYVGDTFSPADLTIQNLTAGTTVPAANIAIDYTGATHTASIRFPGYTNGVLPDGSYRATLTASGIADNSGNTLVPPSNPFNFFVLSADANHDRTVNALDFNALASHYGASGATFSSGNFNYDSVVDSADFTILSTKFGVTLIAPPAAPLAMRVSELFGTSQIKDITDDVLK